VYSSRRVKEWLALGALPNLHVETLDLVQLIHEKHIGV
jgi:hypothetical protein